MFRLIPLILAGVWFATPESATAASGVPRPTKAFRSATKARDIGGFVLGMNIRDAAKLAPLESIGNGQFQTAKDGIKYDFSVTNLGRIYRVDFEQAVGNFAIDDAFLRALTAKLSAKYGPPANVTPTTFKWSLIEKVERTGGQVLPFETNWASAYVERETRGVTVYVKLIDFRIMWADEAKINQVPSNQGAQALQF